MKATVASAVAIGLLQLMLLSSDPAYAVPHESMAASLGAGGAVVRRETTKLNSYEQLLENSTTDSRKAKKWIRYDNYRTEKSKY